MHSFPSFEPIHCSTSGFKCCFLTCTQDSQEEGKVVWYCHHFRYFPLFVAIHAVNEAEVDFYPPLEFPCFIYDPADVGNLISGPSAFFEIQLVHLEVLSSHTIGAQPEGFLVLLCWHVK